MAWSPIQPKKHDKRKSNGVGGGGGRRGGERGGQNMKKGAVGGRQYRGGLHKIRELPPFCQLCKEIFPSSPIIKPTPPTIRGLTPITATKMWSSCIYLSGGVYILRFCLYGKSSLFPQVKRVLKNIFLWNSFTGCIQNIYKTYKPCKDTNV